MTDLRFMIVNSNLPHAQQIVHELQNRVSFDVFQDTNEKNIWGLLGGGKDDVYVYDRCGRLAYYIPFPLSIMNHQEGDLVTSAILATYYRSPCGSSCERNSSTLEDFLNNVDMEESQVDSTTEENIATTELYRDNLLPNQTENNVALLESDSSLLEEGTEPKVNQSYVRYDYPTYDETLEDYDNNETDTKHDHAFFNSLYNFFFNSNRDTLNTNETLPANASLTGTKQDQTFYNSLYNRIVGTTEKPKVKDEEANQISIPLNISEEMISENTSTTETESTTNPTPKPKPDRCAEAGQSVCKNWSKKRLLRAHNCCSSVESAHESRDHQLLRDCKNFGKKRCKKIKTILKCCIKTALFETTTLQTDEEETVAATTTDQPVTTDINEVVCCRDVDEGKLCRVSEKPTCELGEYLQEEVTEIEAAPMEERVM